MHKTSYYSMGFDTKKDLPNLRLLLEPYASLRDERMDALKPKMALLIFGHVDFKQDI